MRPCDVAQHSRNEATTRPACRSRRRGGTHVVACYTTPTSPTCVCRPAGQSNRSARWSRCGRVSAKPLATLALAGVALGSLFHYVTKGPTRSPQKEIEDEIEKEVMQNDPRPEDLKRYNASERANHWVVGISFILLALSPGLAGLHPAFFPLTQLFRGPTWSPHHPPYLGDGVSRHRHVLPLQASEQDDAGGQGMAVENEEHGGWQRPTCRNRTLRTTAARKSCSGPWPCVLLLMMVSGLFIWRTWFGFDIARPAWAPWCNAAAGARR